MTSSLFAYAVGLLACVLVYYSQSPATATQRQMRRTPRPAINESLLALDDWHGNLSCGADGYTVHLFSKAPLIVYVEGFLSASERAHLIEISEPAFEPATITHNGGAATQRDQTVRDSEVAVIPRDEVVRCIEARARAFQGWRDEQWVERLRTQRYRPGGHYNHHFDWSSSFGGWGRVSSFMVWVDGSPEDQANPLVGGGTEFPLVKRASLHEKWCQFIECEPKDVKIDLASSESAGHAAGAAQDIESGVVFKPLAGNAVYWENFRADRTGRGWDETWHAGLPVIAGTKIGLNIWTWGRID
ncbi:unnamed protein product [Discula destructiva]